MIDKILGTREEMLKIIKESVDDGDGEKMEIDLNVDVAYGDCDDKEKISYKKVSL